MFKIIKNKKTRKPFFLNLIKKFRDFKQSHQLLTKIFYTIFLILIFRFLASIIMPGFTIKKQDSKEGSSFFMEMLDLVGGGGLANLSIVALGISPYITASIIMQLLQTEAFPPLHRLSKSGPAGKRKINFITRVFTFIFAYIQAITIIQTLQGKDGQGFLQIDKDYTHNFFIWGFYPIVLASTSLFALFLADQITNNGVGNGTSLLIFSGITATLVGRIRNIFNWFVYKNSPAYDYFSFFLYMFFIIFIFFIITFVYLSQRRIPLQQTGAGLAVEEKKLPFLPIPLNPAGIMPIIFSMTILTLPTTIIQFVHHQNVVRVWIENNLKFTEFFGLFLFVLISFVFSIIMAIITFNPFEVADRFKKNGTFIIGIKPGEETENYLSDIIIRISIFSGIYLAIINSIQYIQDKFFYIESQYTFSGSSLIILVSVAIETIDHLQVRQTSQEITKTKREAELSSNNKELEGFIW
ncbi:MAG: preprotein translocase subunit SecY [Mycoplasma sp.]|nr:preprotein translocase subunit SecY [Mycoplasma sp.]